MLDMQWMEDRFKDKEDSSQLCLQNKQQLHTKENVLLIFHFFRNCNKSLKNLEIAAKVLIELKKFWVRSNIPTQQDWWARKCIVDLNTKYVNVLKNIKRETETEVSKRNSFTADLKKLFDIASPEAEKELQADRLLGKEKAQEDLLFLESQRTDRIAKMGDLDTEFEDKVIKSTKRKAQQTKYQGNEIQKSKKPV